MRRAIARQAAAAAIALVAGAAAAQGKVDASAQAPAAETAAFDGSEPLRLPAEAAVRAAFEQTPLRAGALASLSAEQSAARATAAGSAEWAVSVTGLRHRQTDPTSSNWGEWQLGIDRPLRSGTKRSTAEAAGSARVAQAEVGVRQAWQSHARAVLERWGVWQRSEAEARVNRELAELLATQASAVETRARLGDAARIEREQAQAALLQARAQVEAAASRAALARDALLALVPDAADPVRTEALPASPEEPEAAAIEAQLDVDATLALARAEARSLAAQADVDIAERRPDPTVGLRVGADRSGDRIVGLVLSMPLPGEARSARAESSVRRASAAALAADELARQLRLDAMQRVREAALARAQWARQREAAARLAGVADGLARGFALGEGTLSDVLAARRVAHEQALAAALAQVDDTLAQARLALASGRLWPAPPR